MLSRRLILVLPMLLLGVDGLTLSQAPAQSADPAEPIRRLYSVYGIGDAMELGKLPRQDPAMLYSRSLLALYRRATKAGLDFDFFVQGQDFSLARPIDVGSIVIHGDRATAAATLTSNFVDPKTHQKRIDQFSFFLVKEGSRWRIDEVVHARESLRHAWQEMIQNPA